MHAATTDVFQQLLQMGYTQTTIEEAMRNSEDKSIDGMMDYIFYSMSEAEQNNRGNQEKSHFLSEKETRLGFSLVTFGCLVGLVGYLVETEGLKGN